MTRQFVSFQAGARRRLARLADVQEIIPMVALEDLERGGRRFRGVVNLRGDVVPVYDLGGGAPLSPSQFILVFRADDGRAGLIVDEVHDVVTVEGGHVAAPAVAPGEAAQVVRLGEELVPVWEPSRTLDAR